ncbi:hypothetical protein CDAR_555511 [Caerostris darwini]|uniref:Uncharacterized protein n=1 Tax=Caerostris darwini TaxID=1538125 RepID=A0AAV4QVG9_9ARAC|nr:hypothetical protein CDAR_555511 [Caerostris darwini]
MKNSRILFISTNKVHKKSLSTTEDKNHHSTNVEPFEVHHEERKNPKNKEYNPFSTNEEQKIFLMPMRKRQKASQEHTSFYEKLRNPKKLENPIYFNQRGTQEVRFLPLTSKNHHSTNVEQFSVCHEEYKNPLNPMKNTISRFISTNEETRIIFLTR